MDLDEMFKQFSDLVELQEYCAKQHATLTKIIDENAKLKIEVSHLKELLNASVPNLSIVPGSSISLITDEENICKLELEKLRISSLERSLSFEEAKKVEIYTKLLLSIQSKKDKKDPVDTSKLNEADLLALVENNDSSKTK
jgi:regulator of replication initiation timing